MEKSFDIPCIKCLSSTYSYIQEHVRSVLQTTNNESIIKVAASTNISIFYYVYKKKFYMDEEDCVMCDVNLRLNHCDAALNEKSNETKRKYFIGIPAYNHM